MQTRIWIDTMSGTWGECSPEFPVVVAAVDVDADGFTPFDDMTDDEICAWGIEHGTPIDLSEHFEA